MRFNNVNNMLKRSLAFVICIIICIYISIYVSTLVCGNTSHTQLGQGASTAYTHIPKYLVSPSTPNSVTIGDTLDIKIQYLQDETNILPPLPPLQLYYHHTSFTHQTKIIPPLLSSKIYNTKDKIYKLQTATRHYKHQNT